MSSSEKDSIGQPMEMQILNAIKEDENTLGTLNNYGDNLLHLSAANDCRKIIKEILKHKVISDVNRKNDCGWTPLMQAIRNGNVETVKLLLANGYNPNENTFQDISPIGLAAAMGLTMFETVYNACPAALEHAKYDNISPLCAAVIRGDEKLVFRLLELGVNVSEASEYTLMLMRQSRIPAIVKLVEARSVTEDYWTEDWDAVDCLEYLQEKFQDPRLSSTLDNIEVPVEGSQENSNDTENFAVLPTIHINSPSNKKINRRNSEPLKLNLSIDVNKSKSLISPRLSYTREQTFPASPKPLRFVRKEEHSELQESAAENNTFEDLNDDFIDSLSSNMLLNSTFNDESKIHKYKINRPPDIKISKDADARTEHSLEHERFNPTAVVIKTPTEPRCKTPLAAVTLDANQKKMAILLQRFGLTHFIFTFLTQEVDLDLFLTLNDQDLQEIGIESKSDRNVLLSVIAECNRYNM